MILNFGTKSISKIYGVAQNRFPKKMAPKVSVNSDVVTLFILFYLFFISTREEKKKYGTYLLANRMYVPHHHFLYIVTDNQILSAIPNSSKVYYIDLSYLYYGNY